MEVTEKNPNSRNGFTLVELLVVISIIGVLASIVMVSVNSVRASARMTRAKADLQQIMKAIEIARDNSNATLMEITSEDCSDCGPCRGAGDLRNIPDTHPCAATMNTQFQKLGLPRAPRDPWGAPYLIDENEGEDVPCIPTRLDHIYSAGPDGIDEAESWTDAVLLRIPQFFPCS